MAVSTIARRPWATLVLLSGVLIVGAGGLAVVDVVTHDGGRGPVLLRVTSQHGLHLGDVPMLLMPVVGLALIGLGLRLARRSR